jgi:hypothetical protein
LTATLLPTSSAEHNAETVRKEAVAATPATSATWKRHRFATDRPEPRDRWYHRRYSQALADLLAAGRVGRGCAGMINWLVAQAQDTLDDLLKITIASNAAAMHVSPRTISAWRREALKAGLLEYEHRSLQLSNGEHLGLPNKIRFRLPPDMAAVVANRVQAAARDHKEPGKGRATPKAPQNGQQAYNPAIDPVSPDTHNRRLDEARKDHPCPACQGHGQLILPDETQQRCRICSGSGVNRSHRAGP